MKFLLVSFIKILMLLSLFGLALSARSDGSCVSSSYPQDAYLMNTIYGYVYNTLNQEGYTCSANNGQIKICQSGNCVNVSNSNTGLLPFSDLQIPSLATFPLQLLTIDEQNCLVINTIDGLQPLNCFADSSATPIAPVINPPACTNLANSCFGTLSSPNSQLLFNFSGRMFQCVTESMHNIFFTQLTCEGATDENSETRLSGVNSFAVIVSWFGQIVGALLIMYVIALGIKIVLNPYKVEAQEYVIAVIKVVAVTYFTVGLQSSTVISGNIATTVSNGMVDVVLPLLSSIISDLSQIVLNSARLNPASSGLCSFDPASYASGYGYYALFDMIDCRMGYFLGYGMLYDVTSGQNWHGSQGAFSFFSVLCGLLLGSPMLAIFNALFVYIFVSTLLVKFIGTYIVYYIFLYAMVMISPIFIPAILFKQTASIFYGWLRVTLSFALQPAIIAAFITMMLSVYDQALYGDCIFTKVGQNPATFAVTDNGSNSCNQSYGYQLYQMYLGNNWQNHNFTFLSLEIIPAQAQFVMAAFQALLISFVIYKLAITAVNFAASLTGSIGIDLVGSANKKHHGAPPSQSASDKARGGGAKNAASDKALTGSS